MDGGVQPSSVDLRVDRYFRVFRNDTTPFIDPKLAQEDLTELVEVGSEGSFILHPGEFVLGSTLERVALPDDLVARLEGKVEPGPARACSSTRPRGSSTRGGTVISRSSCRTSPTSLSRSIPEMKIGQISFLQMTTPAEHPYGSGDAGSKYQGQRGPTPEPLLPELPRSLMMLPWRPAFERQSLAWPTATRAPCDPTEVLGRRFAAYLIDGLFSLVVLVGILRDRVAPVAQGRACRRVRDPPQPECERRNVLQLDVRPARQSRVGLEARWVLHRGWARRPGQLPQCDGAADASRVPASASSRSACASSTNRVSTRTSGACSRGGCCSCSSTARVPRGPDHGARHASAPPRGRHRVRHLRGEQGERRSTDRARALDGSAARAGVRRRARGARIRPSGSGMGTAARTACSCISAARRRSGLRPARRRPRP